jgi:hypothetical protein
MHHTPINAPLSRVALEAEAPHKIIPAPPTASTRPKTATRKRVAFLFNHYDNHQILHAAPYAFALSKRSELFDVHILCSCTSQLEFVQNIAAAYSDHNCHFTVLKIPLWAKTLDPLVSQWVFIRKQAALKANMELLSSFDAIVSPERTTSKLHDSYGLTDPEFIRILHGAGDRDGGVSPGSQAFGLTLLPGQKYLERVLQSQDAACSHYVVSGCAKFEAVEKLTPHPPKLFNNDNPTVVYAPHFDQKVSSWSKMGIDILDYFRTHTHYNLIFAPHVVLFKRARRHKAHLPKRFVDTDTMMFDTGSQRSVDMSYMRAADIYLGDASSQVYEFLDQARPCIFADAHHTNWQDNNFYQHWKFGDVVQNIAGLEQALEQAHDRHAHYAPVQSQMFNYSFSKNDTPVSERGANLIANHLLRT